MIWMQWSPTDPQICQQVVTAEILIFLWGGQSDRTEIMIEILSNFLWDLSIAYAYTSCDFEDTLGGWKDFRNTLFAQGLAFLCEIFQKQLVCILNNTKEDYYRVGLTEEAEMSNLTKRICSSFSWCLIRGVESAFSWPLWDWGSM